MARSRRKIEAATPCHRGAKHFAVLFGETQTGEAEKDGILEDQVTPGVIGIAAKLGAGCGRDPGCCVAQYRRHARRIEVSVPVVTAQLLEQAVYFVLLGAAHLQEREQIRLLVFEMDREFIREEGHDGRGLGGRSTAEVGDPVQDGASLALAQVHGMQVVDRPAKQGRIDRRQTERTPRLICLLHGMPFRRLQIGARLAPVIVARSARSFTKSRDARAQADFSSACAIFGRTVS